MLWGTPLIRSLNEGTLIYRAHFAVPNTMSVYFSIIDTRASLIRETFSCSLYIVPPTFAYVASWQM